MTMVKISAGLNVAGHGGEFKLVSSYPDTLPPCHSLVDKIKLKKKKAVVVIHTNEEGETSITERKIGENDVH